MSALRQAPKQFFVPQPLRVGQQVRLEKDLSHRLAKVLRLPDGAQVALCDNQTGRYLAQLEDKGRSAKVTKQLAVLTPPAPLALWLGLPKREAWETALRQATELGATHIQPLTTRFSQISQLKGERATAHLTEAAEQSERLTLPTLQPLLSLQEALQTLTTPLWWASEVAPATTPLPTVPPGAVLVGPEGGFAAEEIEMLTNHPHVHACSLGPTILRTDTAVTSALTLARHKHQI